MSTRKIRYLKRELRKAQAELNDLSRSAAPVGGYVIIPTDEMGQLEGPIMAIGPTPEEAEEDLHYEIGGKEPVGSVGDYSDRRVVDFVILKATPELLEEVEVAGGDIRYDLVGPAHNPTVDLDRDYDELSR